MYVCQDPHEREYVVCDKYLEQIFGCARMKLAEVPARLNALLHAPDPIVINHLITVEPPHDAKQTACYDIDVEVTNSRSHARTNTHKTYTHTHTRSRSHTYTQLRTRIEMKQ